MCNSACGYLFLVSRRDHNSRIVLAIHGHPPLKNESGPSFRTREWRLYCDNKNHVPLMFAAEIDETAVGKRTIMMTADAAANEEAGGFPVRVGRYEMWSGSLDFGTFRAIMASRSLHVRETTRKPDETADATKFDIDATGLPSAGRSSRHHAHRRRPRRRALGRQRLSGRGS